MKTRKQRPEPQRSVDAKGNAIVRVPLDHTGTSWAIVDAPEFDRLSAEGAGRGWYLNSNGKGRAYVRAWPTGGKRIVTLSRVILGAGPGQIVRHRNDDVRDLRKVNLYAQTGSSRRRDRIEVLGLPEWSGTPALA